MALTALPVLNAYVDDGGSEMVIWEQLEDGTSRSRRVRAEYVTWHHVEDIGHKRMRQLKSLSTVRSIKLVDDFVRVGWVDEIARRMGRKGMRENEVESYEGDVDPVILWLVESLATIAKPRRCYLDLEGDSRVPLSRKLDQRILTWSITDAATGEELSGELLEDTDEAERVMLLEIARILDSYDQIVVWEGDWRDAEYDSVVLPARWRRRGIDVDERRWVWLNMLAVWRKMNMQTAESGAEKESMSLENIAFEQIGEGKAKAPDFVLERFGSKKSLAALSWDLYDAGGKFRELLREYNRKDTRLLRLLEEKKGFLTLFQAVCEACGLINETRSLQPTRQMDGFLLRLGRAQKIRFPTKSFRENDEEEDAGKFRGAVVFHPKSVESNKKDEFAWSAEQAREWRRANGFSNGIIKSVHVCDFASLYPSVMRTWNLSTDALVGWQPQGKKELAPDTCVSPGTGLVTRTDVIGIIPLALAKFIELRKYWSDLAASLPPGSEEAADAQAKSNAYKVIANSFYGGGGSKFSRFNNRDVSEATTQNSVYLLKLTAAESEKRKMVVVYGDTDSNMVIGPSEEGFRAFVNWLNVKKFPAEIASFGCRENFIKLAFEKTFERVIFVSAKAYVGRFEQYKGTPADRECHGLFRGFKKGAFAWRDDEDPKKGAIVAHGETCPKCGTIGKLAGAPEIKGVAWKRGDKGKLTRELQGKIIDCLVGGVKLKSEDGKKVPANPGIDTPTEDLSVYHAILSKARDHVLSDPLPIEEVRLSKSIRKPLKEYGTENVDAHIKIARILKERGENIGQGARVEYVVVDGDVSPQVVIPADDYSGVLDRFYLWERVYEPSRSLLEAAFPDHDWASWANVRPPKPRGKAAKVPEGQLGMRLTPIVAAGSDFGGTLARADEADELAVPTYITKPLVVRIPEGATSEENDATLERVKKTMLEYPGARSVEIVISLRSGQEAVLTSKIRVSPGPRFKEAVERAISGG